MRGPSAAQVVYQQRRVGGGRALRPHALQHARRRQPGLGVVVPALLHGVAEDGEALGKIGTVSVAWVIRLRILRFNKSPIRIPMDEDDDYVYVKKKYS